MALLHNKIYNIDCLEGMKQLPDDCIDLTVTSPPYDNLRTYKGYSFDFEPIARELYRITKEGGVVVWIVGDATIKGNETGTSFRQALYFKEIGFNLWDTMIYQKTPRAGCGNNRGYWQNFEYMFVFSKGQPKSINLICDRPNKTTIGKHKGTKRLSNGEIIDVIRGGYGEFGRRTNVWTYSTGKGHSTKDEVAFKHPAIFPETLAEDHILSWSNKDDLVFDPFMGSGTTAKAAHNLGRFFLGFEVSEEYCKIIEERLGIYTELMPLTVKGNY